MDSGDSNESIKLKINRKDDYIGVRSSERHALTGSLQYF